jgi:hypothetical protein
MPVLTATDVAYFKTLMGRYADGATSALVDFEAAKEAKCHQNADAFFQACPDCPPVRGWLVTEIGNAPGYFRFVAHSVNRTPDGQFVDSTPLRAEERRAYRFVLHDGAAGEYNRLKTLWPDLIFPVIDAVALFDSGTEYDDRDEALHLLP